MGAGCGVLLGGADEINICLEYNENSVKTFGFKRRNEWELLCS